jgi:hypothetical protein
MNKKVIGKMKDEMSGELILEFVAVKSKLYSSLTESAKTSKRKAKGISKHVTENLLRHDDYVKCVKEGIISVQDMKQIRSNSHQVYTLSLNKKALSPMDTKRWICSDKISTLPFGHYKTV